jgi:acetolactate synthase-1/2/3 large subunit
MDTPMPSTETMNAEVYLSQLARRGVEYVFANAGTDFAPIIEALSRQSGGVKYPRFITVPHENLAMAMAYGYYRATGKIAAVMCHVSVGTANTVCGLMNAARDNIPILLAAGRTPLTETGHIASRDRQIHWGQECFDQGGMLREFVKWDYELRAGQPVDTVVDRALDIAMSEPRGPVYLTLPRETLADGGIRSARPGDGLAQGVTPTAPDPKAIDEAAKLIAGAKFPLVITSSAGLTTAGFHALSALASKAVLPVVQQDAYTNNIPSGHEMNLGYEMSKAMMEKADVILVIDTKVPWSPQHMQPKSSTKLIHISADPLMSRQMPFHGFRYDLSIAGSVPLALPMLEKAVLAAQKGKEKAVETRKAEVAELRAAFLAASAKAVEAARTRKPLLGVHIADCINQLKAKDAIIISELGLPVRYLDLPEPNSFVGGTLAGGLGLGLGAALGAKLGAPKREVITSVGDGSYMFGNPLPYHFVQRAEKLPILTIVTNNLQWYAVNRSTIAVYPKGKAAAANQMPLTSLDPSPAFEKMVETCGGYGAKVESPDEVMPALKKAFEAVRSGTPALLNMITEGR